MSSLREQFVGDALQNHIQPRVHLAARGLDDAIAARERVVREEFDFAVRIEWLSRGHDQFRIGVVQANSQAIRADGPIEGGTNQIENGFGLNGERATKQAFGDRDSQSDGFVLALFEPMVSLSVQLIRGVLQRGKSGIQSRISG